MKTSQNLDLPYEVTPTNIPGAFAVVAPADDFDPRTASDADLIKHGVLWPRPGKADVPALHAAWDRFFSRPWRAQDRIVPRLEPQIGRTHNLRGAKRVEDTSVFSYNWAGGALAGTWNFAAGFWVVPTVSPGVDPQSSTGGWASASWVGLDGAYGTDDPLQAGVNQAVDANGNPSYVAWFEWYAPQQPDSPPYIYQTSIPNFAISPGDQVFCAVAYVGNDSSNPPYTAGQISFANFSAGQSFQITLAPPPGASFSGNCAEWIMEALGVGGTIASLPSFTPVQFSNADCYNTLTSTTGNPATGDTWNITDAEGDALTSVTLGAYELVIDYAATQ